MPTRSKIGGNDQWAARQVGPRRSVFVNYSSQKKVNEASPAAATMAETPLNAKEDLRTLRPLQSAVDCAIARSFLYRFLAQAYQDPTSESWAQVTDPASHRMLESTAKTIDADSDFARAALTLRTFLEPSRFDCFLEDYLAAFGHAARGRCPLNEIEYGDLKADPLFQPHRLADLAAFYRAFGLEVVDDAGERPDHICLELEFMCVLAAKEAYCLEYQFSSEELSACRGAQKRFLREHLGRWTPAFTRRLARMVTDSPLGALADFTRIFIEAESERFGIPCGNEDLLLRPVDEPAESLCNSCGVPQQPPGALAPEGGPV